MEGVNKPELLPTGDFTPVIDVAGFLTDGEVSKPRPCKAYSILTFPDSHISFPSSLPPPLRKLHMPRLIEHLRFRRPVSAPRLTSSRQTRDSS